MNRLENKIVLITGASSGIGREVAHEVSKKGGIVILCARNIDKLYQVKKECEDISQKTAYIYSLDISDVNQIDHVISNIYSSFGKVDVLINNAGFGITENFISTDRKFIHKMFQVNVLGLMYITQLVAIEMTKIKKGHIINTASIAGKVATPKSSIYSATKGAVIGFSNALRMELKPLDIKVTTVNTGPVDTPFLDNFDPSEEYYSKMQYFILSSEEIAKKLVSIIGKNKREINLPILLGVGAKLYGIFPGIGDYLLTHLFQK